MKRNESVERGLESRVLAMGMEVVEVEWAGSGARPVIRLRIDFSDSEPGAGVTVDDCARVSRALEDWLDIHPDVPERYVLEVSSPGVERPLRRRRDFQRFEGEEAKLVLRGPEGSGVVSGVLAGVEESDAGWSVLIQTVDGGTRRVGEEEIARANLVFRWEDEE